MPALTLTTNAKKVEAAWGKLRPAMRAFLVDGLKEAGIETQRRIQDSIERRVVRQSGRLRRAVVFKLQNDKGSVTLRVGFLATKGGKPNPIYAAQVNFGGEILPKRGKFLVWRDRGEYAINLGPQKPQKPGKRKPKGRLVFARRVWQAGRHFLEQPFAEFPSIVRDKMAATYRLKLKEGFDAAAGGK